MRQMTLTMLAIILCFILIPLISDASLSCPDQCRCMSRQRLVNCTGGRIDSIPYTLNVRTEKLILARNLIRQVTEDELRNYPMLKLLDISYQVEPVELRGRPFMHLKKLEQLFLNRSPLQRIRPNTFSGLAKLITLDLSRTMDQTKLTSLNGLLFSGLGNLRKLNLGYNGISQIEADVFYGLDRMELLNLEHNQLTALPVMTGAINLKTLILHGNKIITLNSGSFDGLGNLETLILNGNPVKTIEVDSFKSLKVLRKFSLTDSLLTQVPSRAILALSKLEFLDLSNSHISILEKDSIYDLPRLQYLNISYCPNLTVIKRGAFSRLPDLVSLRISYNRQLSTVAPSWIDESFLLLRELYINDNNLSSVPKGGILWNSLDQLAFSRNPLDCSCILSWLASACSKKDWPDCQLARCAGPDALTDKTLRHLRRTCASNQSKGKLAAGSALWWTLAVLIPIIVIICLVLFGYLFRTHITQCCCKGKSSICLCKRSSFQSKQPLVCAKYVKKANRWRQQPDILDRTSDDLTGQIGSPLPSGGGNEAYKVLAEYPVPITEL